MNKITFVSFLIITFFNCVTADFAQNLPPLNLAGNWNFALDDCDHILRIVSDEVEPMNAILLLQAQGFECKELE